MVVDMSLDDNDNDSSPPLVDSSSDDGGPYGLANPISCDEVSSGEESDTMGSERKCLKSCIRSTVSNEGARGQSSPVSEGVIACEDALPAPPGAVDVSDISDRIIADTGTGNDLIAAEKTYPYASSIVKVKAIKLSTANDRIKANKALRGVVPLLGNQSSSFYILKSCPTAISIGTRVMNEDSSFIWLAGRRPAFVFADGHVAVLSIIHDVPYIDAHAYVTPIEDPSLPLVCGITYESNNGKIALTCEFHPVQGGSCQYDELGCAPAPRQAELREIALPTMQVGGSSSSRDLATPTGIPSTTDRSRVSGDNPVMLVLPTTADARTLYRDHVKAHKSDSGLDLLCVAERNVSPGETVRIGLGIKAVVKEGGQDVGWLVVPRSSLAKTPLRISSGVGVIDASYRGEIFAVFEG